MESMSRTELADLHLTLLLLEREEEKKRQAHRAKDSTLELKVKTVENEEALHLLTLEHDSGKRLPKHCMEQGNQVSVSPTSMSAVVKGDTPYAVVKTVTPVYLTLSFSYEPQFEIRQTVFIKQMENEDYTQLSDAIRWLKRVETDRTNHSNEHAVLLVREMFKGHQQQANNVASGPNVPLVSGPDVPLADKASSLRFISQRLNVSQREAVELALSEQRLAIIHGPPGTGKTTTVVEVILQHVERGQRVLVCAPSNKAVDNLVEGVWKQTQRSSCELSMDDVFRLGNLARMDEKHRQFSPELRLEKRLKGTGDFVTLFREQQRLSTQMLETALVVMSTLTSVRSVELERTFDLLVIDECAQATEAACWLAIPLARKVVLAGDPCQLPPTILSQEAARRGLAVSLMERQMELHGEGVVHMLDTQYRMHELIQAWSSRNMYGGRLKAAPEVGNHLLTELPGVHSTKRTQPTLLLVDTDGWKMNETRDAKTNSYRNNGEANLVVCHAKSLVEAGLPAKDIGVITPYKQQVALIDGKMRAAGLDVEVNSVDGYQGREKEAILLSLVRSNRHGQVGFVGDRRRLNVAVTRARRHLFVVCDTATVCLDYTIRSLVMHMEQNGAVRSAFCDQSPPRKEENSADDDDEDNAGDISSLKRHLSAMFVLAPRGGGKA